MAEYREPFSPTHSSIPWAFVEDSSLSNVLGIQDSIVAELFNAYVLNSGMESPTASSPSVSSIHTGSFIPDPESTMSDFEDDDPSHQTTRDSPTKIVSFALPGTDFVEALKRIGNGKVFGAVTAVRPYDIVGFLKFDESKNILQISTTSDELFDAHVPYIAKVRYMNRNGDLEVLFNGDTFVSKTNVLNFSHQQFEEILIGLDGKIVSARLVGDRTIFGVFKLLTSLGFDADEDEGVQRCEVREIPTRAHRFEASALLSIEFQDNENGVMRYQRFGV